MTEETADPGLEGLTNAEALLVIAQAVDAAGEAGDMAALDQVMALADLLDARGLSDVEAAQLDYFRSNAWGIRYGVRHGDVAAAWSWDQPEIQAQIFHLRRARNSAGFTQLHPQHRCQILTNLGNMLSTLGRFVEARAAWSEVLAIIPKFWMARGNRANGLMYVAGALYDRQVAAIFALRAYQDYQAALAHIEEFPQFDDPRHGIDYAAHAEAIAAQLDVEAMAASLDLESGDLEPEPAYRRWALDHTLFLDPLNDLEPCVAAASDAMALPDFSTGVGEPQVIAGFFSQLKQEYASARWLLYEGLRSEEGPHPSDVGVVVYNTLDYPAYGLATEKLKVAYRMAYSVLDKVAYFLNHYLALGVPERQVSFRSIWREKDGAVRAAFTEARNLPWRGLYWLSKDLFEARELGVMAPDAEDLASLRNHLEHKYVKVVEMGPFPRGPDAPKSVLDDDLAYTIGRSQLEAKSLRVLKLTRAALIYLLLGMHSEEARRAAARPAGKLVMPMILETWEDERKR